MTFKELSLLNYTNIQELTWDELTTALKSCSYVPPITVHLPIQPVGSPDFVHVDCALNAVRRRVYPRMSVGDGDRCKEVDKLPLWLVQFALDNPPFVPDLRRTTLAFKKYPSAWACSISRAALVLAICSLLVLFAIYL